ncbi:MAG: hypothetical protein OEU59_06165 [Gammaproteobacteria bacterium]|jgi:hypothetical protein|nr:hypothetical protein [Gammaproteobacteria bacterium]MDH3984432.1 hypothetical protein [Gammaproteobacteria bacterium]
MRSATNVVIVISFLWLLVSFWNRNELPGSIDYIAGIANEPQQTGTDRRSFEAVWDGVAYRVDPEYDYDLVGMIVSFRHHDENSRMHRLADDHLNMLDVCVVWGNNTSGAQLDKIDFWNGIFTCNVKTRDQAAWESFDMYQLSNNHLISDDDFIRDQVRKVKVGDQVRIQGVLASYESPGGLRGTSTTRTDTGDGACETIYVDRFEILQPATSYWRISMYAALATLSVGLFLFFRRPFKSHLH